MAWPIMNSFNVHMSMSIQDYGHSIYTSVSYGMFPILINKTNTSSDMISISQPFQNVFNGSEQVDKPIHLMLNSST